MRVATIERPPKADRRVRAKLPRVVELCRRFRVRRLELFGSAASGTFDPARSDVDFLVDFEPLEPRPYTDCYFGLLEALQDLFLRRVDLVDVAAVTNPYFLAVAGRAKVLLYAA